MTFTEIRFDSDGTSCAGWHFKASGDALTGPGGRPVLVMAHGFGGTKDSGLQPFAEQFAAAGIEVLAFDYRGFGASDGEPRQQISITRQVHDYEAAVTVAQRLHGVDANRVVLWGSSLSGGHVIRVGAGREDVIAVIAMTPLTNSLATGRAVMAQYNVLTALRSTLNGVVSRVEVARGRRPVMMPLVSRPGGAGALALDGAYDSYVSLAGPTWRNEVDAAVGLELAMIKTKAHAKALRGKLLVQIADFDRYVPADAVAKTAEHGRGQVHRYPCDHFDVWPGHDWFDKACGDQVRFLERVLASAVRAPDPAVTL
ncbi:alpha/beta hydrolase [Mycolicibacterium mengxianglii]|uniref:alpha/beta hydrolase n=1 Tax=Mycolicibacterium mengxianglii TaxID=2736649 RepID=UPI0018D0B460|nr:alpha/beta fold hydrolase [Mycolicibacterium mengxianglii]